MRCGAWAGPIVPGPSGYPLAPMRAPPRHRPRSHKPLQTREETVRIPDLRPRMVLAPLVLFVLILVMVGFAVVVALALLPIFGAAGEGVNAFRERLDAAGVGRAGIPHLPQSSTRKDQGQSISMHAHFDLSKKECAERIIIRNHI